MRGAALLCALALVACQASTPRVPDGPPSVVLIVTDTLRADHVGAYGYQRPTTPFFDRFAARGFLFQNAYAPTSWTRPAVASLFTGRYPQRHGVQMRRSALPEEVLTLAEAAKARGLRTAMLTTNPHVTATWGMTQGFDRVVELMPNPERLKSGNRAAVVVQQLGRLLPELKHPFFLYVHLIDPHYPYEPPQRDLMAVAGLDASKEPRDLYDGEVHYADRHVGALLDQLNDNWLLDDTVVVLTSDHGEELGDHGALGHGRTLYEEVLRIPLAMQVPASRLPRVNGRQVSCPRIKAPVSLIDLAPTLRRLLGASARGDVDGVDLTPAMLCEDLPSRPLFFSLDKEGQSLAAIRLGPRKLIVDRATGATTLFDLERNPGEQIHGRSRRPSVQALERKLAAELAAFEASSRPGLHLELAGPDGIADRRQLTVSLRTNGQFVDLAPTSLEANDRVRLSDDGKELHVAVELEAQWHSSPVDVWVQDRDALSFALTPVDAAVWATLAHGETPASQTLLRLGASTKAGQGSVWPIRIERRALQTNGRLSDRRAEGVYLYEQRSRPTREVDEVSEEMAGALRALGYVQ